MPRGVIRLDGSGARPVAVSNADEGHLEKPRGVASGRDAVSDIVPLAVLDRGGAGMVIGPAGISRPNPSSVRCNAKSPECPSAYARIA
jgi:hypothetical protein